MNFDDFPPDCPPEDADDTNNETVYRFINGEHATPRASDFLSYAQEEKEVSQKKLCQSHGLSVLITLGAVRAALRKIPTLRKKRVAKGTLGTGMGKLKNTPARLDDHRTWWLASDAPKQPEEIFSLIEIEPSNHT